MHLLYLHQYFAFPEDSGGTRSFDLAKRFVKNNIKVEIITSSANIKENTSKKWTVLKRNGLIVHVLNLNYKNELNYFKRIIVFFKFIIYASFKILSIKSDLVLATSTPLTIIVPALIKKLFNGTPYIFETRDIWPEAVIAIGAINNRYLKKILFYLESISYRYSKNIVALSSDMYLSIVKRYPQFKSKVTVIENIAEIQRFQNGYQINKNIIKNYIGFIPRFSIIYAGTLGKVNDLKYLITLCSELYKIDSSIIFLIVGEGAEKTALCQLANRYGILNKNIFFIGSVSKNELPQLYYEVDMGSSFVAPIKELWSNSANKFFDTLAAGRPILINYSGWQKTIIEKYNIGKVFPSNLSEINNQLLIDFSKYTYDQKKLYLQGENAFKLAVEKYSLDVTVKKYMQLLNQ